MHEQTAINRLTISDIDKIIGLWEKAELPFKPKGRDTRDNIEKRVQKGTDIFFGIFEGEELIAEVLVTHDGRKGWINRLAVDPPYRRRGLGKKLISFSEQYLHDQGIQIIAALIEDYNKTSLSLFQECGYVLHRDIYYLSKRENSDV